MCIVLLKVCGCEKVETDFILVWDVADGASFQPGVSSTKMKQNNSNN